MLPIAIVIFSNFDRAYRIYFWRIMPGKVYRFDIPNNSNGTPDVNIVLKEWKLWFVKNIGIEGHDWDIDFIKDEHDFLIKVHMKVRRKHIDSMTWFMLSNG